MITLYSSHCPKCLMLESMLKKKNVEFVVVDDEKVYLEIADNNNIMTMPFAQLDGKILNTKELETYIIGLK